MSDVEERLVVALEARIRDFERNMTKAERGGSNSFQSLRRNSGSATRQMEKDMIRSTTRINQALATTSTKIGEFGKAKIGGIVGTAIGLGIGGLVASVKGVADAVANVGDQARMAGLSFKVFQEWKYVAEQARIPVDAITDGLKELQLRADEFAITGKGSAAEAFQRLGLTPEEVKTRLKNPTELMLLLIERTRLLKDTAAGVRIFDELFGGTGGERMVALIEQGEAGIRSQIKAANDFGHVLSDEVITKAQEIDRQFNAISMTVGNTLKSAIVSVIGSMMDFIDSLRAVENQRAGTIQSSINDIMRQKQEAAQALAAVDAADSKLHERQRNKARGTHKLKMAQLDEEENRLIKELENRPEVMSFVPKGGATWTPPAYTPPPESKKTRSSSISQAERERQAVKDLITELEEELRIVNASDAVKRASVASRQAGAAATDIERHKIIALNETIYQEEQARRRSDEQMLFYRDLTRSGLDDLFNGLEQGKGFWQSMGDVAVNSLKRIADTMLNDVLDSLFQVNKAASGSGSGGGFLGSLFGGLFGGGKGAFPAAPKSPVGLYAKGDAFPAGINGFSNKIVSKPTMFAFADGAGLMGEAGAEAIMPLKRDGSGRLGVSASVTSPQSSQTVSAPVTISIDATGADAAGLMRVQQQLDQMRRDLPGAIVSTVKSAQGRRQI